MNRLKNKIAIITGGAGEIGKATAKTFALEGAKVILIDINEKMLKKSLKEINNPNVEYITADVEKPDEVKDYINFVKKKFKKIDILFNNAGIGGVVKPIVEYPNDIFNKVLSVNIKGIWFNLKYTMMAMQNAGSGSIIISSSIVGIRGSKYVAPYVTSKHAVIGLMKTAALEGAPFNIRVNCINPGPVEGRLIKSFEEKYSQIPDIGSNYDFLETIPLKRYGTSEEVSKLVSFLASDDSSYITGGIYSIDGGSSVRR